MVNVLTGNFSVSVPETVESKLIGVSIVIGYLLFCFGLAVPFMAFVRFLYPENLMFFVTTMVLFLPLFILADMMVAVIIVDREGIERRGLLNRRTVIPWNELAQIKLVRGTAGFREIVIKSRRKKIAFRNELLLMPRRNFWPAVRKILHQADKQGVEVKAGLLGRDVWFSPGHNIDNDH